VVAAFSLPTGLFYAASWSAWRMGYATWLGAPYALGMYWPHQYVGWFIKASTAYPWAFRWPNKVILTSAALSMVAIVAARWRRRGGEFGETPTTFGSSQWATERKIKRMGLLGPRGMPLGRIPSARGWRYLLHDGDRHVLVVAPTGTRKTTSNVAPPLLTLGMGRQRPRSVVVHDMKGELRKMTAGHRARFSRVLTYNPTTLRTHRHNPLDEVRLDINLVRDVQNIIDIVVDPDGTDEKRDHWEKASFGLLTGATMHVLDAEKDKSLTGVRAFLAHPGRSCDEALRIMLETPRKNAMVGRAIAMEAQIVKNKAPNDKSGVLSEAMDFLALFADPLVQHATSASDFHLSDLQDGGEPISLYYVIPRSDMSRLRPLMRMQFNLLCRGLRDNEPRPTTLPLDLILDEFTALGHMDFYEHALAFMRGYKMRATHVVQSLRQLDETYGPNNAIVEGCHIKVFYAAGDERTAKRISDMVASTTQMRKVTGYTGKRWALWFDRTSVSASETERPLVTVGEVLQLDSTEAIVVVNAAPPIRASKIDLYQTPELMRLMLPPPELPWHDVPEELPSHEGTAAATPDVTVTSPEVSPDRSPETEDMRYMLG
jgi:type IV secretion system protein VirD4